MADQRITEITAATSAADTDLLVFVEDPAGTAETKSITVAELFVGRASAGGGGSVSAIDVTRLALAQQGLAVYSGCEVTEDNAGAGMDVDVSAGHIRLTTSVGVLVTAGEVTLDTADATNARIDLVWVNTSGTLGKTTGTPAATPVPPDIPSNSVLLAIVSVPASDTTITNSQITDKRTYTKLPQIIRQTANASNTNAASFTNSELTITMAANERWVGNWNVAYDGADSNTPDFDFDFTVPASAAGIRSIAATPQAATSFSGDVQLLQTGVTGTSNAGTVNTGFSGGMPLTIQTNVLNSTTPGNQLFRFKRNAGSGTATIRANSWVIAWPLF